MIVQLFRQSHIGSKKEQRNYKAWEMEEFKHML